MEETSLIIKHRPKTFQEVVGQDEVVKSLTQIVKAGIARTFLFVGPSGTGKTTLARIVAHAVGCSDAGIIEVDAASYTGIEDMRQVTESARYKPLLSVSQKRAIIIDECHALSRAAIQSLLKSLEEPAPWQYWMLCTTEGHRILETIKTRSVVVNLKSVGRDELIDLLEDVKKKEGFKTPSDILALCAKEANGSPRQALSYLASCAHAKDRKEAAKLILTSFGSDSAFTLAQALASNKDWSDLREIILNLKDQNPESIRHVVREYFTKTVLNSNKPNLNHLEILELFQGPFSQSDGITPVLLAVSRLKFGATER